MKIRRFNESAHMYDNIILKVTDESGNECCDVKFSDVKDTEAYWRYMNRAKNPNDTRHDYVESAIYFGLEEYLKYHYDIEYFSFEIEDEYGDKIDDIEFYEDMKKYNV